MRKHRLARWSVRGGPLLGVLLLLSHPGPGASGPRPDPGREGVERGQRVFFKERFGGNDRTCGTCHQPAAGFSVTPEGVEALFQEDASHPLFRAIDSDHGDGRTYFILREHAVFVVGLELHPSVRLADDPEKRVLQVRRAVPSVVNVALTGPYLLDGRAPTLPQQALGAIFTHMEPRRLPRLEELEAVARFQREFLSPPHLAALLGPEPPDDPGFAQPLATVAARRGKLDFDSSCSVCHSGPLLHRPPSPAVSHFLNVLVSERNRPGFPIFHLVFAQPDGSEIDALTPDPGRAATTGSIGDLNSFEIPSLRGIKHTAPYFHDNSAASLEDVIQHYNLVFGFDIRGQRLQDMLTYLETL